MAQIWSFKYALDYIIRKKRTAFCHRPTFKDREDRSQNFASHSVPSRHGSNDMQGNLYSRLQGQKVRHSEKSAINRGCMLNFKCMRNRPPIEPNHINILNRLKLDFGHFWNSARQIKALNF